MPKHEGSLGFSVGICVSIMGCFVMGFWGGGGSAEGLGYPDSRVHMGDTNALLLSLCACLGLTGGWSQG